MKAEEKAKELVGKFKDLVMIDYRGDEEPLLECQKQCALIAVYQVKKFIADHELAFKAEPRQQGGNSIATANKYLNYWQDVKEEIEKL